MKSCLRILLAMAICMLFAGPALALERITGYHSTVHVRQDRSVLVEEEITVIAEGDQIKHGIYRDFPTTYGPLYNQTVKGFKLLSVFRDGEVEQYDTANQFNGVRVYAGDKNTVIPHGTYTYKIAYESTEQVGTFADHDELYWNVTGNGWAFPIDKASVTIILPAQVPKDSIRFTAYIGPQDSKEVSPLHEMLSDTLNAEASRPLGAREGFTVVFGWPKGLVQNAPQPMVPAWLGGDQAIPGILLPIVILFFYGFLWYRVGRDPDSGPAPVCYEPPKGLTPAEVRFINNMGTFDNECLSVAVMSLAVQGYLTITEAGGIYTFTRTVKDPSAIQNEEAVAYRSMFGNAPAPVATAPKEAPKQGLMGAIANIFKTPQDAPGSFSLRRSNWQQVASLLDDVKEYLQGSGKMLFVTNYKHLLWALIPFGLFFLYHVASIISHSQFDRFFMIFFASFWNGVVSVFVFACLGLWAQVFSSKNPVTVFPALFLTVFLIPFVGVGLFTGSMAFGLVSIVGLMISLVAIVVFARILPRRTTVARELQNRIDGFLKFLKSQSRYIDGVKMDLPAKFSMYEHYLPYAIALGVEPQWSAQFKNTFAQMSVQNMQTTPVWYYSSHGFTHFSSSGLSSAISSSITSSSTNPSSSSGFSGGSSGGGGGGGGGGGW